MQGETVSFLGVILGMVLILSDSGLAEIPAPPVNQQIGIQDSLFYNLRAADCRLCHANLDAFPVDPATIPDRHHLLMNTPIGSPNSAPFDDPPGNNGKNG